MKFSNNLLAILVLLLFIAYSCKEKQKETPEAAKEQWLKLFNGKNLDGWSPKIKGHAIN